MRDLGRKLDRSESGLRKIRSLVRGGSGSKAPVPQKLERAAPVASPVSQLDSVEKIVKQILLWMDRERIYVGDRVRIIKDVDWRLGDPGSGRADLRQKAGGIDLEHRPPYVKADDLGMLNGWILWLSCYLVRFDEWKAVLNKIKAQIATPLPGDWSTP
jgi:hypothetical protein